MIVKTLLVMLAVIVVIMPDAEAGCRLECPLKCYRWRCKVECKMVCNGKREIKWEDDEPSTAPKVVVKLPYNMAFYDANKDGRISSKEFLKTLPRRLRKGQSGALANFRSLDKNGDGFVSCKELGKIAPGGKAEC